MNRLPIALRRAAFAAFQVAAAPALVVAPQVAPLQEIAWQHDLDAAAAQSRKEHKPLLALFRCER